MVNTSTIEVSSLETLNQAKHSLENTDYLRSDLKPILSWVKPQSSVLDCGCGDGSLLLALSKHTKLCYGLEKNPELLLSCLQKQLQVIHHDLEDGLTLFEDKSFDTVILSRTLQTIHQTEALLKELIRVGKQVIVSFPNFGYWQHRLSVLMGRMPVSKSLPYQWYNTPNVRVLTIADFEALAPSLGIEILDKLTLNVQSTHTQTINHFANWRANLALYVVKAE